MDSMRAVDVKGTLERSFEAYGITIDQKIFDVGAGPSMLILANEINSKLAFKLGDTITSDKL